MPIIEERLFNVRGQLMAQTKTPLITDLRERWKSLWKNIHDYSWHRYEGKRGICFLLKDGRILIVMLGRAEAMAGTMTPARHDVIAAD